MIPELFPHYFLHAPRKTGPDVHVSPLLVKAATCEVEEVYRLLQTAPGGLRETEALRRRLEYLASRFFLETVTEPFKTHSKFAFTLSSIQSLSATSTATAGRIWSRQA